MLILKIWMLKNYFPTFFDFVSKFSFVFSKIWRLIFGFWIFLNKSREILVFVLRLVFLLFPIKYGKLPLPTWTIHFVNSGFAIPADATKKNARPVIAPENAGATETNAVWQPGVWRPENYFCHQIKLVWWEFFFDKTFLPENNSSKFKKFWVVDYIKQKKILFVAILFF